MNDEKEKRMVENYEITQEIRIGDRDFGQLVSKIVCWGRIEEVFV